MDQDGFAEFFHGDGFFGAVVNAKAAAEAIVRRHALPVNNFSGAEGTNFYAGLASLALVPVGERGEKAVN